MRTLVILFVLFCGLMFFTQGAVAGAPPAPVPIVAVDMDPSTPGIQSTLGVTLGTTFTVDVVTYLVDPGPFFFEGVILQTSYNSAGAVLGPGPTGATWLDPGLATQPPGSILDLGSGLPPDLTPGGAVTGPPEGPYPGYTSSSDPVGLLNQFPFVMDSPPLLTTDIFSIDYTALLVGSSSILAHYDGRAGFAGVNFLNGAPIGSYPFFGVIGGEPLLANSLYGMVTVTDSSEPIPEPATMLLLGTGLVGVAGAARRKKKK